MQQRRFCELRSSKRNELDQSWVINTLSVAYRKKVVLEFCRWRSWLRNSSHFPYTVCFIRPQVEYCSSVWDPRPGVEKNGSYRIERIQRRAARWCLRRYKNTSSVTNKLDDLGWRTLEQRRIDSRLMALFKITRGLLSVNSHGLLRPVMCMTRRSHSKSFIALQTSLSSEYLSFFKKKNNYLIGES